jgi:drug/metabolite transporter (DMT)-like permease
MKPNLLDRTRSVGLNAPVQVINFRPNEQYMPDKSSTLRSDILLLITATIWGFAFVAQRVGMEYLGPFAFNGIRFALGSLSLIPLLNYTKRKHTRVATPQQKAASTTAYKGGCLAGLVLFIAASLQQVGLQFTTAGNAGFITGLYVVIVPILGLCIGQKASAGTWSGAMLAATGLYFLSITESFSIAYGDLLEVIGAVFWAGHVLLIGRYSPKTNPIKLAAIQFAICSLLSLATAFCIEVITLEGIVGAAIPILYGGLGSVGVAYTLQVVAQKNAHPAHAAILLSLEAVFAAFGGWLLLGEQLTSRGAMGCALMLAGMLLSQLGGYAVYKIKQAIGKQTR